MLVLRDLLASAASIFSTVKWGHRQQVAVSEGFGEDVMVDCLQSSEDGVWCRATASLPPLWREHREPGHTSESPQVPQALTGRAASTPLKLVCLESGLRLEQDGLRRDAPGRGVSGYNWHYIAGPTHSECGAESWGHVVASASRTLHFLILHASVFTDQHFSVLMEAETSLADVP